MRESPAATGNGDTSPDAARTRWRWIKWGLALVAAAAVALVAWSAWDREAMAAWKRDLSPFPFFVAMTVLPALGLPLTPFLVLAGATFGARVGLIGSGIALVLNLAACYWVARSAVRPWLESLLKKFGYELPDFEKKKEGVLRFTFAVKLAPGVPAFVKNYGLGAAGVPFALYLGISMLVTGLYAVALILLGESLFEHDIPLFVIVGAVTILVAFLCFRWWRKSASSPAHQAPR